MPSRDTPRLGADEREPGSPRVVLPSYSAPSGRAGIRRSAGGKGAWLGAVALGDLNPCSEGISTIEDRMNHVVQSCFKYLKVTEESSGAERIRPRSGRDF
jgi:hypothetical protein